MFPAKKKMKKTSARRVSANITNSSFTITRSSTKTNEDVKSLRGDTKPIVEEKVAKAIKRITKATVRR